MNHYELPNVQPLTALLLLTASTLVQADHPGTGFGASSSGPITTISASTLPAGVKAIGLDATYVKAKPFSNERLAGFADRHVHAHSTDFLTSTAIGLGYGLTNDFTIGLRLPYISRDNIRAGHHSHAGGVTTNEAQAHGNSRGIGDLSAIGKYRFLNDAAINQEAAVLFGVELPTGTTSRINRQGGRFETEHQPGSDSWDPLLGLAYTKRVGKLSFDTNVLYKVATKGAQATDLGDQFFYNIALSYRILGAAGAVTEADHHHDHAEAQVPHHHDDPSASGGANVNLVMELNGEWQDKQRTARVTDDNSGGGTVYLAPGIRISAFQSWGANVSIGIPVVQNLRDAHPESDWRLTVGVAKGF